MKTVVRSFSGDSGDCLVLRFMEMSMHETEGDGKGGLWGTSSSNENPILHQG